MLSRFSRPTAAWSCWIWPPGRRRVRGCRPTPRSARSACAAWPCRCVIAASVDARSARRRNATLLTHVGGGRGCPVCHSVSPFAFLQGRPSARMGRGRTVWPGQGPGATIDGHVVATGVDHGQPSGWVGIDGARWTSMPQLARPAAGSMSWPPTPRRSWPSPARPNSSRSSPGICPERPCGHSNPVGCSGGMSSSGPTTVTNRPAPRRRRSSRDKSFVSSMRAKATYSAS